MLCLEHYKLLFPRFLATPCPTKRLGGETQMHEKACVAAPTQRARRRRLVAHSQKLLYRRRTPLGHSTTKSQKVVHELFREAKSLQKVYTHGAHHLCASTPLYGAALRHIIQIVSNVAIARSGVSSKASTPRVVTRAARHRYFLVHGQQGNSRFRAK